MNNTYVHVIISITVLQTFNNQTEKVLECNAPVLKCSYIMLLFLKLIL